MPLQIANPTVVRKVEVLAHATGLSKTAAVERAVDRLLQELEAAPASAQRLEALLAQLDRIPDRTDAFNPIEWDELGLPR
jgi:antitoxin VapB